MKASTRFSRFIQSYNIRQGSRLGALVSCLLVSLNSWADNRPNIILMVADDHGREAFGAYGNDKIRTPHLDQLAKEGIKFDHAYATSASCSASRSVILSGQHNHANGQYGHNHSYHHFNTFNTVKSLPVRLSEAGYRTAQVGKYHIGPRAVYKFEQYLKVKDQSKDGSRNSVGMATAAKPLINAKSKKPFFLYLATNDPHRDHSTNSTGDNTFGNAPDDKGLGVKRLDYDPKEVIVPHYLPDTPETRRELAEYYQSVSRVDDTMGELVSLLKQADMYDNTVIFYLSDNGTAMPGAKTTLYDPGARLPLVIKPAGANDKHAGTTTQAMVSWPDLTPTILSLAQVNYQAEDFHGKSFTDVLADPQKTHGFDQVYGSHTFHEITMYYPMRSIRTRDYKLIWNIASGLQYPFASDLQVSSTWQSTMARNLTHFGARTVEAYLHRPKFELYDMRPKVEQGVEATNLADDADYQKIKFELIQKLQAFQKSTKDPWVYKWDYE
ncbi:heparan N-sulfatase [Saccharobesus litoralis]|uniref:Heparan N-sulfatase n=1 Tax=Saccharobesus litoralis TaxID=2172099 RepID=A0A2S0VL48_9ALTE|nr:sulfatase [Saccharobesus litoralis]AWB64927.1 heparan N-sulfatase [Saccharobesus litoralis]AWB66330.1 heparan N-sulfatase [Saccharobesus litoralis]